MLIFSILMSNYTSYSLSNPALISYPIPGVYQIYPGITWAFNYATLTQASIVAELDQTKIGLGCSSVYRMTRNAASDPTISMTSPTAGVLPTYTAQASLLSSTNAAPLTPYSPLVAYDPECHSTYEYISSTAKSFSANVFNDLSSTQLTSIFCNVGSASTATLSLATPPSWLGYSDSTGYLSGVMPTGTTSASSNTSVSFSDIVLTLFQTLDLTLTGTCSDSL